MPKSNVTKSAADIEVTQIHTMTFKSENFADTDAVETYLKDNGYQYTGAIKSVDAGFEITGEQEDSFVEGSIRELDTGVGIVIKAGNLSAEGTTKSATTEDEPDTVIVVRTNGEDTPLSELTAKFDDFMAYYSNGTTVDDVMADANDGAPPGLWEVNMAFHSALKNVLKSGGAGRSKAVKSLAAEFGDYINKLADVFAAMLEDGDTEGATKMADALAKDATKDAAGNGAPVETKTPEEEAAAKAEAEAQAATEAANPSADDAGTTGEDPAVAAKETGQVDPVPTTEATDVVEEVAVDDAASAPAAKTDEADAIGQAVAKALAPVVAPLAQGLAAVQETLKEQGTAIAELQESSKKTAEQVDGLETATRSRKSVDADGNVIEDGYVKPQPMSKAERNMFGFMNPANGFNQSA